MEKQAEMRAALEKALPFINYMHHYDQRRMTAAEAQECADTQKAILKVLRNPTAR